MAFKMTREFYIPVGSVKVADKVTGAVVYLYEDGGVPKAVAFHGKADKPDWRFYFRDHAEREKRVRSFFAHWRQVADQKSQRKAEAKTRPIELEAGDILSTCWGYDQSNREFFEVIEIRGTFAILREIEQVIEHTGDMTGYCVPQSGKYIGNEIRRRIKGNGCKIDEVRWGSKWNTSKVAGVAVGPKIGWTAYS